MTIITTAWDRSPDGGMGLARDMRVRWALEEVGQPYEVRLVSLRAKTEPAHLRLHPFGLIPTYEEGDLALFETGAIVFHIAEHQVGLCPDDADARARAITWMFAALNTVEPPILELVTAKFAEGASGRSRPNGRSTPAIRKRADQVRIESPPFRDLLVAISDEMCGRCSSALGPPDRADRGDGAQVLDQHPVDRESALA